MFGERTAEVLIAGAGPVGLFTALSLARRGVGVRIVDTGVWACTHSYALALHPQVLKLFEEAGLGERVLGSCYPVRRLDLADATGVQARVTVELDGRPLAVLRQDVLESMLERALNELGVKVDWRQELGPVETSPNGVRATINRFEKESRGYIVAHTEWVVAATTEQEVEYVVGADGYNSRVRRALHYDFPEVGPAEYYAVFEFSTTAGLDHAMTLVCGERTCDILWPLPGGGARWSFHLPGYHDATAEGVKDALDRAGYGNVPTERVKDRVMRSEGNRQTVLSDAHLRALLAERAPWFDTSTIGDIGWRTVVRFERRLATGFGQGRLWLAGDAAHLTAPGGIQSMNAGLEEGHALAVALAAILRDGASPATLELYAQRALHNWRVLHGQTGGLQATPEAAPLAAAHASALLGALPGTAETVGALAAQLGLGFASQSAGQAK